MKAFLVAGLGFGDEGKGTTTEALAHKHNANLVVRYNGGAQAAHNVVTNSGRHHTFSQFGSATFLGRQTYLSRFMMVDPGALMMEAKHLQAEGISDPFALLYIDKSAPLITPYHRAANRLREWSRQGGKHGSCGIGIGECAQDLLDLGRGWDGVPTVGDIGKVNLLRDKLDRIRHRKIKQLKESGAINGPEEHLKLLTIDPHEVMERWYDYLKAPISVVDEEFLARSLRETNVVFEGAQGVLLDQDYGFHPHTTYSDCTWGNAHALLKMVAFNGETEHWGVMRSYQTRHGAGPFPTEDPNFKHPNTEHNKIHDFQGNFRAGPLDLMLLRYALGVLQRVDRLAVTHLDCAPAHMVYNYDEATMFDSPSNIIWDEDIVIFRPPSLSHQEQLGQVLSKAKPNVVYNFDLERITSFADTPIGMTSAGPRLKDKVWHG